MRRARIQVGAPGPGKICRLALRMFSFLRSVASAGLVAVLFWAPVFAQKQEQPLSEYQVKALYLMNFTRFVEWPQGSFSDPEAPLVIGIVGRDPFGTALQELTPSARGRRVVIEHFNWDQEFSHCHALFISRSERKHVGAILGNVKGKQVLTVSEIDDFSASGGVIGFVFEDDRVRFDINLDEAEKSHLKISSQLSSVARTVKEEEFGKQDAIAVPKQLKIPLPRP